MSDPLFAPAPEWPGATSAKFADAFTGKVTSKRVVDTGCRNGPEYSVAQQGLGGFFADAAGLIPTQGKRVFPVQSSEVCEWRPSCRYAPEPGSQHVEKPEGRRIPEKPARRVVSLREKRHIIQASSKEEVYDQPVGPKTVFRENGLRAADQPAREADLSLHMQRKVRTLDLHSQRNNLGCRSLGDKCYRHPEYEKGFHHARGLVVGSTFMRGISKKTEPQSGGSMTLVLAEGRRPVKSYAETQRELQLREAQSEVAALTRQWEASTLKECDDKYEEPLFSDDEAAVKED